LSNIRSSSRGRSERPFGLSSPASVERVLAWCECRSAPRPQTSGYSIRLSGAQLGQWRSAKLLNLQDGGKGGIEPPTRGFSGCRLTLRLTGLIHDVDVIQGVSRKQGGACGKPRKLRTGVLVQSLVQTTPISPREAYKHAVRFTSGHASKPGASGGPMAAAIVGKSMTALASPLTSSRSASLRLRRKVAATSRSSESGVCM
jgi:hypothetical protein